MSFLASIEMIGFLSCCAGIWFINQARVRLTSDGRLTLLLLLSLVGGVHLLDVLEWTGSEVADRLGDILKIFTPAVWLFFLFVVRRDGLLKQVAQQGQQLDFFFQQTPMAIAVLDEQHRYLAVSQRWLEMHQIKSDPKGQRLADTAHSKAARWAQVASEASPQLGSAPMSGLERSVQDQTEVWLEWKLKRFDVNGAGQGMILLVEDVTERVKQEQARESTQSRIMRQQSLEVIGEISAGVAHDVNNLLQVISAHAASLDTEKFSKDDFRESLDSIRDAVFCRHRR